MTNMFESVRRGKQCEMHLPNLQWSMRQFKVSGSEFPWVVFGQVGKAR